MYRDEMIVRLEEGEDPLELAIEKWTDIVVNLDIIEGFGNYDRMLETGAANCALCRVFDHCDGCPVYEAGYKMCADTPFSMFSVAFASGDLGAMLIHAKNELSFLKGLRKKNVQR